ncbi:MAG: glycosyltransferase family 39 protein [Fibrobacter sp.]|nr:glycosyltransferase family 39 protein [Fibrobacter sp.]
MSGDNNRIRTRTSHILEILLLAAIFLAGIHLLRERIDQKIIPYGDEGSWMSVASEVARGNGFATRWLEYPFLKPYAVPRPDDFRYPALTLIIASAFSVFGISYTVALQVIASIFLLFGLLIYYTVRCRYGRATGLTVYFLTTFSLLQLMWNSEVYTEGLFGVILASIVLVSVKVDPGKLKWWILTGILMGILYLVRPNGIIFVPSLVIYALILWRKKRIRLYYLLISLMIVFIVISPWLIRTYLHFGNPFHFAGSGGLLRTTQTDPATYTLKEFIGMHGVRYFFTSIRQGVLTFFGVLSSQEHGLNIIPMLYCVIAAFSRQRFYNGFITISFALTFVACAYASKMYGWGGVRYFSPFLPFLYAYGISFLFKTATSLLSSLTGTENSYLKPAGISLIMLLIAAPVIYPHRYYERILSTKPIDSRDDYFTELKEQLSASDIYYAGRLGQFNFATGFRCIGIQDLYTSEDLLEAQKHFNPQLMVLTHEEFDSQTFQNFLYTLSTNGYSWRISAENSIARYIRISKN